MSTANIAARVEQREVKRLVRVLTHHGKSDLDTRDKLKKICKENNCNVTLVYVALMSFLKKNHAQVRLSCIQVIDLLFNRSAHFRDLVCADITALFNYGLGAHGYTLPPPLHIANVLVHTTSQVMHGWISNYATAYPQLILAHDYIRYNLNIDITDEQLQSTDTSTATALPPPDVEPLIRILETKVQSVEDNLNSMDTTIELLIPRIDALFDITSDPNSSRDVNLLPRPVTNQEVASSFGLGSSTYRLTVGVSENTLAERSEDNSILHDTLQESYKLMLIRHRDQVESWLHKLSLSSTVSENASVWHKRLSLLKDRMDESQQKAEMLGATLHGYKLDDIQEDIEKSDDETYFEPVTLSFPPNLSAQIAITSDSAPVSNKSTRDGTLSSSSALFEHDLQKRPELLADVTIRKIAYLDPTVNEKDNNSEWISQLSERDRHMIESAPILEGPYLYYQDKTTMAFNTGGFERSHRFLGSSRGDREISQETLKQLQKRTIALEPTALRLRQCRAPRSNGKICLRMCGDFCIHHGSIIDRDEQGVPLNSISGVEDIHFEECDPTTIKAQGTEKIKRKPPVSALLPIKPAESTKDRLMKRLKRSIPIDDTKREEAEYRERNAFRWQEK